MVKADLSRDYYGDLELPPTADILEIKKQFKKLALKYHPDRNIGRESEVNAKFQAIQSAHEVLTDSEQRAKYDAGRLKGRAFGSGFGASMGAPRGNPYANAGSQWAPPPRRNPNVRANPPPSAGAQRYKNFETPGSSASAHKTAQEGAESRRSTYQAWENMRGRPDPAKAYGGKPEAGPGKTWSTPKATPKEHTPHSSRDEKYSVPPRSKGYEDFASGTMPRRSQSTKRAGFMPSDPTGDEPQAGSTSAYFTNRNRRSEVPHMDIPPPPSRRGPPSVSDNDHPRQFREEPGVAREPRLSTPYSTHGGEKTNPFESANINRSKSTRENSDKPNSSAYFSPSGSGDRFRSASPPRSRRHRPQSSADFVPRTDSDPNMARQSTNPPRASAYRQRHTPTVELDSTSSEDEVQRRAPASQKAREYSKAKAKRTGTAASTTGASGQPKDPSLRDFFNDQSTNNTSSQPSIFSFNTDGTAERPTMKGFTSNSAENISTKFTPEDWHGKFEAGDYFMNEQKAANMPPGRTRSGSRVRGRSPIKARQGSRPNLSTQPPVPGLDPKVEPETPIESPGGTRQFSAEEWAQTFKPQTFAPPPHPSPGARPAYPPRKTSRAQRGTGARPKMGSAEVVDDSDSSGEKPLFMGRKSSKPNETTASSTTSSQPATSTDSATPMDIDTDDPPRVPSAPRMASSTLRKEGMAAFTPAAPEGQPRNVPLEPSGAEWRNANSRTEASTAPQPDLPPRGTSSPSKRRATKSAGSDGFESINLETLKNAEPIKQESKGLNGFEDLASNLPFQSQAAARVPIARSPKTGDLDLPKVPKAPNTVNASQPALWQAYLSAFKTYMVDWDMFNCRMISHFTARRYQVQQFRDGWLGGVGDELCIQYMEGVAEDRKVREWWSKAAETHEENMKNFMAMREAAKKQLGGA